MNNALNWRITVTETVVLYIYIRANNTLLQVEIDMELGGLLDNTLLLKANSLIYDIIHEIVRIIEEWCSCDASAHKPFIH